MKSPPSTSPFVIEPTNGLVMEKLLNEFFCSFVYLTFCIFPQRRLIHP
ncbi:hypothetical protein HanIR_Chr01g0025961 [Helianthus annuus]|nr:hypothetical protein HanIR_Chr01g0025961 [Helianthus annuus]